MYIPKNRIINNQYTRGKEYFLITNKKEYVGYYHRFYDGGIFTGKTPDSKNVVGLIPFISNPTPTTDVPLSKLKLSKGNQLYLELQGEDPRDENPKFIPQSYYPSPNEEEYKLGEFVRYFVIKNNEIEYIEVNEETYNKILSQDKSWLWEMYTPFKIDWFIKGDEREVYNINKNLVSITEDRIGKRGLQEFLKNNFSKYWKESLVYTDIVSTFTDDEIANTQ